MKMKNKIELKKSIIISIFVILIWSSIFALFNLYQYSVYTNNFNNKIDQIVTKIATEYPDIQKSDVIEILNGDEKANGNILKEYGIDLKKESIVMENDKYSNMFIILNVGILILLWISLLIVFLKYNNSKDKKLKEITQYIEEIHRKNYKLNIDDNTEDELSILKNEVYKTTIMLKEQTENSLNDKVNLKNSLSDISHQLKTPLTSITIMLDNIIDNPNMDQETRSEFIKDVKREKLCIGYKMKRDSFPIKDDMILDLYLNMLLSINFGNTSIFQEKVRNNNLAMMDGYCFDKAGDILTFIVETDVLDEDGYLALLNEKLNNLVVDGKDLERVKKVWISSEVMKTDYKEAMVNSIVTDLNLYHDFCDHYINLIRDMNIETMNKVIKCLSFKNKALVRMISKKDE